MSDEQPEEGMETVPEGGPDMGKLATSVATGSFLDRIRLASVLTVLTYLTAIYCIVADKITVDTPDDFLKFVGGLAAITAGNAALGKIRNDAKRGLHDG